MNIKTKYNITDIVFFLEDGIIKAKAIIKIIIQVSEKEAKIFYQFSNDINLDFQKTEEKFVFLSKEELINSL